MARKKSHDQFIKEIYNLVGDEYEFLQEYVNAHTKIKCKHNICGNEWEITPDSFLRGTRCPKCAGVAKKTNKNFIQEVYELFGNEYTVIGEYKNNKTKIKIRHNDCDYEWYTRPDHFLKKHGCPKCAKNLKKTTKDFIREICSLVGYEYSVISKYKGALTYITIRHNKCGYEYEVFPSAFLSGNRCPYCNNISKGEEIILMHLKQNNITFKKEYYTEQCKGRIRPLPFDYAIFNEGMLMVLIEYDGEQHYRPVNFGGISDEKALENFKKTQRNDSIKNQYCKDNNIPLLRIPYWEFDNIETILEEWLKEHEVIHSYK